MDQHIEQAAADALLKRGAAFHIPAPFLFRIVGIRRMKVVVRRLYLGTLLHLAGIPDIDSLVPVGRVTPGTDAVIKQMGSEALSVPISTIAVNTLQVCRGVAACLLNSPVRIWIFKRWLAGHLKRTLTLDQLQELVMWLVIYGRGEAFTNTIRLIATMKMTAPILSPDEKGSYDQ